MPCIEVRTAASRPSAARMARRPARRASYSAAAKGRGAGSPLGKAKKAGRSVIGRVLVRGRDARVASRRTGRSGRGPGTEGRRPGATPSPVSGGDPASGRGRAQGGCAGTGDPAGGGATGAGRGREGDGMAAGPTTDGAVRLSVVPRCLDWRALALGLAFATIWSSAFTSSRIVVEYWPPFLVLTVRFLFSGLLALGIGFALGQRIRLTAASGARWWPSASARTRSISGSSTTRCRRCRRGSRRSSPARCRSGSRRSGGCSSASGCRRSRWRGCSRASRACWSS